MVLRVVILRLVAEEELPSPPILPIDGTLEFGNSKS